MTKKDAMFTFGISVLMGVIWVAGEVIMGLWLPIHTKGHIFWFALIVGLTLIISVWHAVITDESMRTDPKREKYEKKTRRRK